MPAWMMPPSTSLTELQLWVGNIPHGWSGKRLAVEMAKSGAWGIVDVKVTARGSVAENLVDFFIKI